MITATGCSRYATENIKYHIIYLSTCMLEIPQKHSTTYTNTDPGNEGCESDWPGSATESLWAMVLVGHDGEGQGEPQRKAKVSPGGHG